MPRASARLTSACTLSTPCACCVMPIAQAKIAARDAAQQRDRARRSSAAGDAARGEQRRPRLAPRRRASTASQPVDVRARRTRDRPRRASTTRLQQQLEQRDVAADVRLQVEVGRPREPNSMLRQSDGTRKRTSPSSRSGLITITWPPRRRSSTSCVIRRGWFDAGLAPTTSDEVGVLEVVERDGRGAACRWRRCSADARRLVAVVRAVVDVVGAVDARQALQQEGGLVAAAARGVEERALGRRRAQRAGGQRRCASSQPMRRKWRSPRPPQRSGSRAGRRASSSRGRPALERRRSCARGRRPRRSAAACRPPAPGSTSCRPRGSCRARCACRRAGRPCRPRRSCRRCASDMRRVSRTTPPASRAFARVYRTAARPPPARSCFAIFAIFAIGCSSRRDGGSSTGRPRTRLGVSAAANGP